MPCFGATSEMHWSVLGTSKVGVLCMYFDHHLSTCYGIYTFIFFIKLTLGWYLHQTDVWSSKQ